MKAMKKVIWLLTMLGALGCAANPKVGITKIDSTTAVLTFNWGPLIKEVDQSTEMKEHCLPFTPKILETKDEQLSGQYRFQKKVTFTCAGSPAQYKQLNLPLEPIR